MKLSWLLPSKVLMIYILAACSLSAHAVVYQAEDYSVYYDKTPKNAGGAYRTNDVDIEQTSDAGGGYNVGWIDQGEWLSYNNLSIPHSGTYTLKMRVASVNGSKVSIDLNGGSTLLGELDIPATRGWQNWRTVSIDAHLNAGNHKLGVYALNGGWNFNWIEVVSKNDDGNTGVSQRDQLSAGESLNVGEALKSKNGLYQLVLQTDRNLVLYGPKGALWASNTMNSDANRLVMQTDGNLVLYGARAKWASGTWRKDANRVVMQDDGNLVIYGTKGAVWASNTVQNQGGNSNSSGNGNNGEATIKPLYNTNTSLEGATQFDRGDAIVTRISDRGRDRHAKENHFQSYDHYLTFYWENRTAGIEIIDYVAKGGDTIRMNVTTQWRLHETEAENRWWYIGKNTLAEYCGNGVMNEIDSRHYYKESNWNCRENREIRVGDKLEFEMSQFLEKTLPRGRENYYGTTYLYIVGEGIVPWETNKSGAFVTGATYQRDSHKVPEKAWLGGDTTLHAQETAETDGHYQQMATNLGFENAQPFVLGRRIHHTSFLSGAHDESAENGIFNELRGKAGTHFVNDRCTACHERNGAAAPAPNGQPLKQWVFKVGDANGNPDPELGSVLQPSNTGGVQGEGNVSIAYWTEANGLRSPNYSFSNGEPERFSARIAPRLVGVGLLEAIPEATILAKEDVNDANGDGISGKASRSKDPVTGDTRLGRFGWKAAISSVKHQVAAALNSDMGVMTSVLPNPDCGKDQSNCGQRGAELADHHLDNLVKYNSVLGVRPQRNSNDATVVLGKNKFNDMGCESCHTATLKTSKHHPFAELRDQTIHPYSDLLLHDMGEGLADNLGEGSATGAEWRTTPLWGLGTSACVTGGVAGQKGWNAFGLDGHEYCTPKHSYLHDGRARSIEEAILWHGGEGEASKQAYERLSNRDKNAVLKFLESL